MQHGEASFKGQLDFNLYYQAWLPQNDPSAVVIIAHGIAEHSSRYSHFASFLASKNLAVYGFDYRGHGKSPGQKGQVEHFAYFEQDLKRFVDLILERHPKEKVFLFGHSMGAIVSLAYVAEYPNRLSGLVVSGTALRIKPRLPVFVRAALLPLAAVFPKAPFSKLDSSTLSRDNKVVDSYNHDPLVFRGKLTTRIAVELVWEMHRVEGLLPQVELPIFIVHGGLDQLSFPEGGQLVYDKVNSKDKELNIYPGLFHEILNEPENQMVMEDIFGWIKRHYQS
jgi:alpha-beta hydrolase superfamily lysophospholipase